MRSALALILVAACGAAPSTTMTTPPSPSGSSSSSSSRDNGAPPTPDARYEASWARFLSEYLRLRPVEATNLGNHDHDGEWPDLTVAGEKELDSVEQRALAELDAISAAELSPEHRLDYAVLKNRLTYAIWRRGAIRSGELDPIGYVGTLADGFDPLVTREFAPAPARARSLAKRLASLSRVASAARARLTRPPRIYTETAIRQNKGLIALVDGGFPELLAQAPDQKESVLTAAKQASQALHDLQSFLEGELLARSDGDFRVGKEKLQQIERFILDADVDADDLVSRARALLAQTQDEMAGTARELWPELMKGAPPPADKKALVRAVLAKLSEDRPTNATIVREATDALREMTEFVRARDLVTVPDQPVKVMEMPEYRRGVAIAYCESAGPLETKGETHVTLSPTPADWPAARAASFYREYSRSMLVDLIVHEAMPGHYLQGWHASKYKAVPRAIFDNGSFVEGWAVYSEWLMAKHGHGGANPSAAGGGAPRSGVLAVRLQRQKMLARVCTNAILDHEIHAGTMDEKAALALMQGEAFQEEGEAVGKWTRARVSHGQLSTYFYGFTELMKMREEAEKQPGFTERAYHDKLLSFGAPSLHQLRAAMGF